jgi:hypothetical protein
MWHRCVVIDFAAGGFASGHLPEADFVLVESRRYVSSSAKECVNYSDLILRRPPPWAAVSKDGRLLGLAVAILRDARKSALLRMRSELIHTLECGRPRCCGVRDSRFQYAVAGMTPRGLRLYRFHFTAIRSSFMHTRITGLGDLRAPEACKKISSLPSHASGGG